MKRLFFLVALFATISSGAQTVNLSTYLTYVDSTVDYAPQLQNALNAAAGKILVFDVPNRIYSTHQLTLKSGTASAPSYIQMNGCTLKPKNFTPSSSSSALLTISAGAQWGPLTETIRVVEGSNTFTSINASKITPGQIILVQKTDTVLWYAGKSPYRDGWYGRVVSVSGSTITMENAAQHTFIANHITQYNKAGYVNISGGSLNLYSLTQGAGIFMKDVLDCRVTHMKIWGKVGTDNVLRQGICAEGINFIADRDSVWDMKTSAAGDAVAYGINVNGYKARVTNCWAQSMKHQILTGGREFWSSEILIENNTVIQGAGLAGQIDLHGMGAGIIRGNKIYAHGPTNTAPCNVRSSGQKWLNNYIEYDLSQTNSANITSYGSPRIFWFSELAYKDIDIIGNKIKFTGTASGSNGQSYFGIFTGGQSQPYMSDMAYGNTGEGLKNCHIEDNYVVGGNLLYTAGQFSSGFTVRRNRVDVSDAYYSNSGYGAITLIPGTFKSSYDVSDNIVVNEKGSSFYSIRSPQSTTSAGGTYTHDTVFVKNSGNSTAPLYFENANNTITNNQGYSASSAALLVQKVTGNTVASNVKSTYANTYTFGTGLWPKNTGGTGNTAPVVNAGIDQTQQLGSGATVLSVNLSGSFTDDNATGATVAWTVVSKPSTATSLSITNSGSLSTSVSNLTAGTYTFRLTVTDAGGLSSVDNMNVTVNGFTNQAPKANAGLDQSITLPTSSLSIQGSATDDGTIASYAWSQVGSTPSVATISSGTTSLPTFSALIAGDYTFRLTVTDNGGLTASDDVVVHVLSDAAPVVNAGTDQTISILSGSTSDTATLSGVATDNGSIASKSWSYVSGPTGSTIVSPASLQTNVIGLLAGTYVFRLSATDNAGQTSTDDVQITVKGYVNQAPTVYISAPAAEASFSPGASVYVKAMASDDKSILKVELYIDGTLYNYQTVAPFDWSITPTAGTHVLTVKAYDTEGLSTTSAGVTIHVGVPPSVKITGPTNGSRFKLSNGVNIVASASDADGTVSRVDFYSNGTLVFSDTNGGNGWGFGWIGSTPVQLTRGSKTLIAKAYDNNNNVTTSAAISITVK
jgi:hypothetical protein